MTLFQSITHHPVAFSVGLALLLVGVWLLRKAGLLVLLCLAIGGAAATARYLVAQGWMPAQLPYEVAVYAGFLVMAVLASRHPVVAADAELVVILILCFAAGPWLAGCLRWPLALLWFFALGGVLLTPIVTIAVLAASLFSFSLGLITTSATSTVFLVCLLVLRLQWGRWGRSYWDPELARDLRAAGIAAVGARHDCTSITRIEVVFVCRNQQKQRLLVSKFRRMNYKVEELPGGSACAQLPAWRVRSWRFPWARLFRIQPDLAFSANRAVTCPPVVTSQSGGVSLEELAARLRSHNGRMLPTEQASGKGIVLAVVDSGSNPSTPALKRAVIERVSFVPDDPDSDDKNNHGTAVAACALAVAPDLQIISVKVLDADGRGTLLRVLRGLSFVAKNRHRIHLMNLSLGALNGDPDCPLCRAVSSLADDGIASCCAAGNSGEQGTGSIECPGASRGTLAVGAVDLQGHVADFSSRGPSRDPNSHKPDVCCFGVTLELPDRRGGQWVASGTSFASPLAAGVVANALQLLGSKATVAAVCDLIRRSCVPVAADSRDPRATGAGIVSVAKLAENLGELRVAASPRRPLPLARFAIRTAALTIALALLAAGWWLGVSHVGCLSPTDSVDKPLVLLGRVRTALNDPHSLLFDDGTGAVPLGWNGQPGTSPLPGRVVVLRARCVAEDAGHVVLQGYSRCQLSLVP